MKLTKVPNGDYYLQKERSGNTFEFPVRATEDKTGRIAITISNQIRCNKELVGKKGTSHTHLRPGGTVLIEGKKYSAISTVGYKEKGDPIEVIEVEGETLKVR